MKRYVNATQQPGSAWREVASKQVLDSDGFLTDYTMYTDGEIYIFMFGDKDLYEPDIDYADWEAETEERAWEWFNSYTGFADEADDDYSIYGSEKVDDESNELDHPDQEFDSAKTSINSNKLPAVYKMISIPDGSVGLDFGGGSFDNAIEFIKDLGATLYVYDPYNRSPEYNKQTIKALRDIGGADWAVNSNVLNVIKEPEARRAVLENISKITKPGAPIYITVYEGRGDKNEGPTKSGYQLNRKTADYLEEIQEVFPDAVRKGKLISATNSKSIDGATRANIEERWAQVDLTSEDEYRYCGNGGRSWVKKDSDHIDTWPTKEEAIEDGKQNYKRTFKYGRDWDVVNLDDNSNIYSSYDPDILDELVNFYYGQDTMTYEDIWDEIVNKYHNEALADDVLEGIDAEKDVYGSSDVEAAESKEYLDQYTKISFGRNWYSVHYNLIDNSPEADAHQMWLDFQASVSLIKLYDDAEYAWAQIENGHINVIKGGKVIQQYYYLDADDVDVENSEWCDAVIELAIKYLEIANKDVTPRIIHNSTNIASEGKANITEPADITESPDGYVYTYCDNCGKRNRVKVHFKDYFSPFDDIEYKCSHCGGRNLLHDPHIYDESGHVVNTSEDIYSEPAEVTDFKNAVNSADTIDDIQFLIYELSDGVAEEACQFAFDTALNSEVDDIDTIKHEVISAIDMYLEDNEWLDLSGSDDLDFIESSQTLDASTDNKLTKLKDEILSAVKDVMMSPNFGFLEDEVREYSVVEVHPEGRVEVRAEVDYDGLMELVSALNPIIQKYDKDSYFEPVEPGILEAYLDI